MIEVNPFPDNFSLYDWGSKVEVRTDQNGKNPYLYALSPLHVVKTADGKTEAFCFGRPVEVDFLSKASKSVSTSLPRYFYSTKDLKKFKSAVRLRHMALEDFIYDYGFVEVGHDPDTMESWYICQADEGRLTD